MDNPERLPTRSATPSTTGVLRWTRKRKGSRTIRSRIGPALHQRDTPRKISPRKMQVSKRRIGTQGPNRFSMQIPGSPQREIGRIDFCKAAQAPGLKVVKPNFSFCCVSHEPEPVT